MDLSKEKQQLFLAEQHFRNNRSHLAKPILEEILSETPENSKANELLAYIYGNEGNLDGAQHFLELACKKVECSAEALYYLGSTQLKKGLFEMASKSLIRSIGKAGVFFEALHDLGTTYARLGKTQDALSCYHNCLNLKKDSFELYSNIAKCLDDLARRDEALSHFDRAIQLKPDYAEAWNDKGTTLHNLKRHDEALSHFDRAIQLKPDYAEAWSNKGLTLHDLKRYDEALSHFDQAIELKPEYAEAWSNKGNALHYLKRYDEARSHYDRAIELKPEYAEAWSNKGNTLHNLKRYDEARSHYDRAIELKPEYAEAWSNKGVTLHDQRRFDEALSHYDRAIQLDPSYYASYMNKSLTCLLLGDFSNGWNLYDYRWKIKDAGKYLYHEFNELNSLENLINKNVLVWAEQGFGDTIQFARFIPKLIELGANVTFEVQKSLENVLQKQLKCRVTSRSNKHEKYDYSIPLLSLPKLFQTNLETIPEPLPYSGSSEHSSRWKNKLKTNGEKINIGLAVSGNPDHKNDHLRSAPLRCVQPLLEIANIFLIQKKVAHEDQEFLAKNDEIIFLGDAIDDFEDTAALIMNMDLILSVDTSLIHLAGTLRKKAFLMLKWVPEWRWLLDRDDSPWYPSVKIFRQQSFGDWNSVIDRISIELQKT
jgi:tetratricopeptide (TPR) repeat protein